MGWDGINFEFDVVIRGFINRRNMFWPIDRTIEGGFEYAELDEYFKSDSQFAPINSCCSVMSFLSVCCPSKVTKERDKSYELVAK